MADTPDVVDLPALSRRLRAFAEAREWGQFHTPKNLVMAIAVEAAELMEPVLWLTSDEADATARADGRDAMADEIADIGIYLIRLADVLDIDLGEAISRKIDRNEERFPADVVRGKATLDG